MKGLSRKKVKFIGSKDYWCHCKLNGMETIDVDTAEHWNHCSEFVKY